MAKWPYNSARWARLRLLKLRTDPLCEYCLPQRLTPATQVDHRQAINKGGDPWEWDNLASTCAPCHSRKTSIEDGGMFKPAKDRRVDPATGKPLDPQHWWSDEESYVLPHGLGRSNIPLTIVCGPPASGKTTYVRDHAARDALIIDLDEIKCRLSGKPFYQAGAAWVKPALQERNVLLASLARDAMHSEAWFIVGAPQDTERKHWQDMLGAGEVILLLPPKSVCKERAAKDSRRKGKEDHFNKAIDQWWSQYRPRTRDTVVRNLSELKTVDRHPPKITEFVL